MKTKSNLDNKAAGILIFFSGVIDLLYLEYKGLAAAKIEVLAFKVVVIPALAILTVYYSITSWIAVLSYSFILSNSSIQQTPLSAKTKAPASKLTSPDLPSFKTEAVRPTPELPFPVVYTLLGAFLEIYFNN